MPGFTPDQERAVTARGDVLVVAGAGTGKTSTLVERCLRRVLDPWERLSLDEVLLVTFTEAAAGEMRRRIRQRLEDAVPSAPDDAWLREQLALVDGAWISTLHSFCLRLVRDHFHDLALDPEFTVLDEAQRAIMATEVLTRVLERHYAGESPTNRAVQELVFAQGGASDEAVRRLVTRLHDFVGTLPEPERWLARESSRFDEPLPHHWREWFRHGLEDWLTEWTEELAGSPRENPKAAECQQALGELAQAAHRGTIGAALKRLAAIDQDWPRGKRTTWRKPLERLFDEAAFLSSLVPGEAAAPHNPPPEDSQAADPLLEDWEWVRPPMKALLTLTREFGAAFAEAKRELAVVDFQDLEQFALRLLWDAAGGGPTPLARTLRRELRYVFVDEYQDINAAQDRIITALAREGDTANRFLVGDVKQSIYRFRLANPHIFQAYARAWSQEGAGAAAVALSDNFRSHEAILHFVNELFPRFMRREVGGIDYDAAARLRFGDAERRRSLAWPPAGPVDDRGVLAREGESCPAAAEARVEVHLCVAHSAAMGADRSTGEEQAEEGVGDRTRAEEEAALVATRLGQLRAQGFPVWSAAERAFRPAAWRDMVILLRSPRNKAEAFAKVFERAGIPLLATRRGLYEALEVSDLLNLLAILDNPLQDIPLLAVLRSPLVGLTVAELAVIRLVQRSGEYWSALRRFHRQAPPRTGDATGALEPIERAAWAKVDQFLGRYEPWRRMAGRVALSQCLEAVLDETHYEDGLELQPRGTQRRANVQRLLALTRQFDQFQRQGLFRFLKFVEAQRAVEYDPEPAVTGVQDAVRLLSIHQSKGLEFPIVVVPDLAKPFNFDDARGPVLLDEDLGLCPLVRPTGRSQTYPSLPHWLAARRLHREVLGEEVRLLYVAATRACDKLILVGTVSASRAETGWPSGGNDRLTTRQLLEVRGSLDWLGRLMPQLTGNSQWLAQGSGQHGSLRWQRHDEPTLLPVSPPPGVEPHPAAPDAATWAALEQRLAWPYPHQPATRETAKTSVTALRRRVTEETDGESRLLFSALPAVTPPTRASTEAVPVLTAAERGTAHHRFLELVDLDQLARPGGAGSEATRLERAGALTTEEASVLDLAALDAFGRSELGRRVLAEREHVRRELEFTLRLSPRDFERLAIPIAPGLGPDEFVVVQGVVDLAVMRPERIWLLDFKTDHLDTAGLPAKIEHYAPQLRLYALALSRIHRRPVTEAWLYFLALDRAVPVPLNRENATAP